MAHGPLPPDDRLWRHPSELAWEHPATSGTSRGATAAAAVGGALLVGVLWLTLGDFGGGVRVATERVALVPTASIAPRVVSAEDWAVEVSHLARSTSHAIVTGPDDPVAAAVAYRDDGYLLTSALAVGADADLYVEGAAGLRPARLVGADPVTDVGVLAVDGLLEPSVVASNPSVRSGETLVVVTPGHDPVTVRVDEPVAASLTVDGEWLVGVVTLHHPARDLPAGSAVVDDTGAVVGLTVAANPDGPGAYVPIDVARDAATEIIDEGRARHARLGVSARDLDADEIVANASAGALVTVVDPGGPAEAGGMLVGDVVVAVDGEPVSTMAEMVAAVRRHEPGEAVAVDVIRGGEPVACHVTLGGT